MAEGARLPSNAVEGGDGAAEDDESAAGDRGRSSVEDSSRRCLREEEGRGGELGGDEGEADESDGGRTGMLGCGGGDEALEAAARERAERTAGSG